MDSIKPAGEGQPSQSHCAIGTIHYENADINAPAGTIIYFKASLTGDEPADIKNYKTKNSTFPHETTADQWFTESQFESYRQLGYHEVMISILGAAAAQGDSPSRAPFPSALSSSGPRNSGPSGESKGEAAEKEKPAKKAAAKSSEKKPEAAEAPPAPPPPPLESLLQPEFAKFGFDVTMLPRARETECHE